MTRGTCFQKHSFALSALPPFFLFTRTGPVSTLGPINSLPSFSSRSGDRLTASRQRKLKPTGVRPKLKILHQSRPRFPQSCIVPFNFPRVLLRMEFFPIKDKFLHNINKKVLFNLKIVRLFWTCGIT